MRLLNKTRNNQTASHEAGNPASLPPLTIGRAIAVALGPSAVLDFLVVASVVTVVRARIRRAWQPRRWLLRLAMLGASFPLVYFLIVRPWHHKWGATRAELGQPLPGDSLTPNPTSQITRAVTVHAPASVVWSWLAQIGQNRGGFYSYDWLENLAGCQIHSANRVHPEWQHPSAGDTLAIVRGWGPKLLEVTPGRALVIDGWGTYAVQPIDAGTSRLLARARQPGGWGLLGYVLFIEIPHFIMERKMLLGIRDRAERRARG
jgi:hypothetical protein